MTNETIEQVKDLGYKDYLYSHCMDEEAEQVLSAFLTKVFDGLNDDDYNNLQDDIIELLEDMEENE